jgi:D-lyxose ketol-isomerase
MKRSEINRVIEEAKTLLHQSNITLPPYAYWSPEDWKHRGVECDEIRDCMLGWDVTDLGTGRFNETGLLVFTLRNGHPTMERYRNKTYCEKILIIQPGQHCPMHFHWLKTEDLINRCGGNLVFKLYDAAADEKLADTDVTVSLDGVEQKFPAGAQVTLRPGESMTISSHLYHEFWAEEGNAPVVAGEVSKVNDDRSDNRFLVPGGRFPEIEEDSTPIHYLCTEYPAAS